MALRAIALLVALALTIESVVAWAPLEEWAALKGLTTTQRSQRVTLRTDDGLNIAATFYEPAQRPAPAVVLVHMLTGSRRDWEAMATRLASEGIGALTIDLRGHGESPGGAGDLTGMVNDVKAARRHLASRPDVNHSRIGIAGASIGANLAVLAAADDPTVTSLALLSPTLDYRGLRIEAALRKYGKRSALLVAGQDDGYAMRSVKDLAKTGGVREVLLLDGAGHGMNMFAHAAELGSQLVGWFVRTLQ